MKDIVIKKNGFTLIELLATIALLAIVVVFVAPRVYEYLTDGYNKTLSLQEKNVEDAVILYVEDYCKSPINYNYNCPLTKTIVEGFAVYSGYVKLSTLINNEYIDEVIFRSETCDSLSYVYYDGTSATAYLNCGNKYMTDGYNETDFSGAK